ncbi:MAG TPA: energy transducer TonB [Longimicrobiaceae bacterium]|nr:energy transducer TonB [Longimicrobiaceae bacterium]
MKRIRPILPLALLAALPLAGCEREPVVETPPRQLSASSFQYPEDLWDAGVEGETTLRLFVTPAGTVDSTRVERPSGQAAFDQAAVEGARDLRFEPARRGQEAVGAWVLLPVQFRMNAEGGARSAAP